MTWWPERALKNLVLDVIDTDDPALCDRACSALAALLANYADGNLQCE